MRNRHRLLAVATAFFLGAITGAAQPVQPEGAAVFVSAGCAGCHGAAGEGRRLAPSLVGSGIASSPGGLVYQILNGSGAMPPLARLSDAEIAAVANHVRMVLNSYTEVVTAEFVASLRD